MSRLDETILEYLRRTGPATPIEVAQRVGANSLIVSAVLIDAASQQKIRRSKRKVGSMGLYYYPEQTQALQRRISNILTPQDKMLLQKIMQENVIGEYEITQQESGIFAGLEDLINGFTIEYKGKIYRCWASPNVPESKAKEIAINKLLSKTPALLKQQEVIREVPQPQILQPTTIEVKEKVPRVSEKIEKVEIGVQKTKAKKAKKDEKKELQTQLANEFRDKVISWLDKNDVEISDEKTLKDGKGFELLVKVPMVLGIGKQTYMVRVLDYGKKGVGQEELSSIAMDAVSKRTPAIVISASGFAKNATKYWQKELQDMIFLVSRDDLE